jgi:hypothetical protein
MNLLTPEQIRKKAVDEFVRLALVIRKRDQWHIGAFLGEVCEEWESKENERIAKNRAAALSGVKQSSELRSGRRKREKSLAR